MAESSDNILKFEENEYERRIFRRAQTTNATAQVLCAIPVASNESLSIFCHWGSREHTATTGTRAGIIGATVERGSTGNVSISGTWNGTASGSFTGATPSITFVADTVNQTAQVLYTGKLGVTIDFGIKIEILRIK